MTNVEKTIPENAVFCCYCGARCEGKKVCRACGTELRKEQLFCHVCGLKWEDDVTSQEAQKGQTTAQQTGNPTVQSTAFRADLSDEIRDLGVSQ